MIIANPIYDVVFKRLMEDERIAKFFIGTLLDETIEEVKVKPQESTHNDKLSGISIFRVDFIATIKTATGEHKKVLIEIQKAKNQVDLMRFRNYWAEQYKKEDEIETTYGTKKLPLPIVTIYLLGFPLAEIDSSAVKVARQYVDMITNQIIPQKSDFVEKLTHDSYIVQLTKIQPKFQTRLDKLLSIFEQNNFVDDSKILKQYNYLVEESGIKNMTDILHYIGTEPKEKKQIEDEQEAQRVWDVVFGDLKEDIIKKKHEIDEKNKALEIKDKELELKDKALEDKDNLIEELMRRLGEK